MAGLAIYHDTSKCTGCKGCQSACKCWNLLPSPLGKNANKPTGSYQSPMDLNGNTRLIMRFEENDNDKKWGVNWSIGRRSCMHCVNPGCAAVCPSGALSVDEETGFVRVQDEKCIGCQYCSGACPFDVPRYYQDGRRINKCTACLDRIANGAQRPVNSGTGTGNPEYNVPACVHTCPPGALRFGDRDELIALAHERVAKLKTKGFADAMVYGEAEMEGTHVIMVLRFPVESYGLPRNPKRGALLDIIGWMKPLTGVAGIGILAGLGLSFLTGLGYKRDQLHYDEKTHETIDLDTGEVLKAGDASGAHAAADASAAAKAGTAAAAKASTAAADASAAAKAGTAAAADADKGDTAAAAAAADADKGDTPVDKGDASEKGGE